MNLRKKTGEKTTNINPRMSRPRHVVIKMAKRILKAANENSYMKGNFIRLSANFSIEILKTRREYNDLFKILKKKTTTKNTLSSKATTENRREGFPQKQKLKEFITTKPDL